MLLNFFSCCWSVRKIMLCKLLEENNTFCHLIKTIRKSSWYHVIYVLLVTGLGRLMRLITLMRLIGFIRDHHQPLRCWMFCKMQVTCAKDGSWNSMISAHLNRQIFANMGIRPYCSMGEEGNINTFAAINEDERWANTPWFPDPSFVEIYITTALLRKRLFTIGEGGQCYQRGVGQIFECKEIEGAKFQCKPFQYADIWWLSWSHKKLP